ncbi:ribonuclease H-like domain-containing protein [Clostridium botulinum]|nr:ribonuclease H-like domain-containing protein [Clostridium botulinum]
MNLDEFSDEQELSFNENKQLYKKAVFFDLEHYVYRKPICVGVFGCCYYNSIKNTINVTQYMIEGKKDVKKILELAKKYFENAYKNMGKEYIITFSGNNDFTVINYLFQKYAIDFDIKEYFKSIDLQREYEKEKKSSIGLKNLEKQFNIIREDKELISGQNLAKTFSKIMKDNDYINRMPEYKKKKILLYNQQDVVSLFHIYTTWNKFIN